MARVIPSFSQFERNTPTLPGATIAATVVRRDNIAERNSRFNIKTKPNVLQYPYATDTDIEGGHHILFHINSSVPAGKLFKGKGKGKDAKGRSFDTGVTAADISAAAGATLSGSQLFSTDTGQTLGDPQKFPIGAKGDPETRRNSFRRLSTSIALYMPPQVQTTYSLNHTDVDLGFASQALVGVFDRMAATSTGSGSAVPPVTKDKLTAMLNKFALGSLNTVAPGARAALQIRLGAIISNKLELSFQGVTRREFTFTFNFTPKSKPEADTIRDIVQTFKFYSHPEFVEGSGGNMMTIPDSFDIEYRVNNQHNAYLHKISTCFCTNIQVQYGGDRYTAHTKNKNGAPPTKTVLTLTFKEMELITKKRIGEGY